VADHCPGLPLEQRIGALRDGEVTHHGEPVGSMPLTVQPPRRPVVSGDIVERLRWLGSIDCPYGCDEVGNPAADEIERLRAALALAAGELVTHHEYRLASPDQLMQQLLKEARRER